MVDLPGINYDARPARARPSRRGCRAVNRQAATKLASLHHFRTVIGRLRRKARTLATTFTVRHNKTDCDCNSFHR